MASLSHEPASQDAGSVTPSRYMPMSVAAIAAPSTNVGLSTGPRLRATPLAYS